MKGTYCHKFQFHAEYANILVHICG